ncbi:glycosyltransferase family 4 protein [Proteiniclasticum sp. QWL-01]|uniref:glycosyltransferase family 4 protein n=1 Tax=Proteiniclasticum sp. QWL-01 TaxID=3036945 RepID=UPI0024113AA7|nr:glycosyltransferase family 4 protein [Proteiniclasticum sp. QWL-01]WFF74411.1 glycosyltransferase family 4 protein [Proteiniclasticum sp. QWL-01]
MKKKYVFISNMAAPYQVKLCDSLQEFLDTEFWFYEYIEKGRPEWWKIPLGNKCKIMRLSVRVPKLGYISFGVIYELFKFKPDVILFGGFMPWHWLLMRIAKLLKVKVAFMSEPLRYKSTEIASNENSSIKMKIIRKMCSGADLYIGMGEVAAKQFIEEIGFPVEKVEIGKYPQDIEEYYNHPLRYKKQGNTFRILFANRLVDRYQPLFALEVFEKLLAKYPNIELYMNNDGPLKEACINYISNSKLNNVHFLDKIDSWNNMHLIYKKSDILILPANYSNGNGTIIEARASGMGVVISTKINHIDKHSIHGENCFICSLNIDEFVNAVSEYIENPDKLIEHGKLSRKLVEDRKNSYTAKAYYDAFRKHKLLN